jgi:hypothetical protein
VGEEAVAAWKPWLVSASKSSRLMVYASVYREANRSAFRKIRFLRISATIEMKAVRGVEDLRTAFTRSPGGKPGQKTGTGVWQ